MKAQVLFIVICFVLVLFPVAANALTFTLSADAIMALDCNEHYFYPYLGNDTHILAITDVNGPGVQFDILFSDPNNNRGQEPAFYWTSSSYDGNGVLSGRDISMFDAFALKFTLISARGVSMPDAVGSLVVGSMINQSHYLWAFYPENIAINDSYIPASTTSITTTSAGQINTVGFTCYIPYWYYNETWPNPWDPNGAIISILVEPAPGAVVMTSNPNQVFQLVSVDKCTIAAGSKTSSDKIFFSGKMNPVYDNLYLTNYIQIAIDSNDMPDPCVIMIPINNADYKKTGKFNYAGTDENGTKKSFKLDFKTHKFSFTAQDVNLSGLSCPFKVGIVLAGFSADTNVDETTVNGGKPIPINFLIGVKDSLRVDKIKVKYGSKADSDILTLSGGFSAKDTDVNMAGAVLSVTLGSQTFTIPAKSFKPNKTKTKFTCSNVTLNGSVGIASAAFDFKKCTFALTIKKVSVEANPYDTVTLAMQFGDFSANAEVEIP